MITRLALTLALLAAAPVRAAPAAPDSLETPTFGKVALVHPARDPTGVVLFLSGDGGWNAGVVDMAKAFAHRGSLVVGIDVPRYLQTFAKSRAACAYPAGDLEILSQFVQKSLGLAQYLKPTLIGYSSGATLAYATLAQAPSGTFNGAVSLGFCADMELAKPPCKGDGLTAKPRGKGNVYDLAPDGALEAPWIALHGERDVVCRYGDVADFVRQVGHGKLVGLPRVGHGFSVQRNWMPQLEAALAEIAAPPPQPDAPAPLPSLPLVARPVHAAGDTLAVLISGDGGWTAMDEQLATGLARVGIPTVGVDALRYFWTARTPETVAQDLAAIAAHYQAAWHRPRLLLLGYSFGADVLPAAMSRLPKATAAAVAALVLVSPSRFATFEIKVAEWMNLATDRTTPVAPELAKLDATKVTCVYGKGDGDSLCTTLAAPVRAVPFDGGHRMNAHADAIAELSAKAAAAQSL